MVRAIPSLAVLILWAGSSSAQAPTASPQTIRPIGVVTTIQAGGITLRTDAGPDLLVTLSEGTSFLRVPPGATTLNGATKIVLSDISPGDRVLVRGRVSDDQKSIVATSVVVMTKADLAGARDAERLDWQRRGIAGTVQSLNPQSKEVTILTPSAAAAPGNPTHPVIVTFSAGAVLLRYAPDSVRFSDAKPSTFEQIKVGDQVRALGAKSADGDHFVAEKIVSGTFRTLTVAVVSVDAQGRTISGTDLASRQPVLVRAKADSKLYRLTPPLARAVVELNSSGSQGNKTGNAGDQPLDLAQILDRAPVLDLNDLKPGDSLIVVSAEGANTSELTAIDILAGVEPILAARPKGSNQSVLGPWTLGMNGGEGGP
jgi:hypothetical protein